MCGWVLREINATFLSEIVKTRDCLADFGVIGVLNYEGVVWISWPRDRVCSHGSIKCGVFPDVLNN
jgi:hypothetical protein